MGAANAGAGIGRAAGGRRAGAPRHRGGRHHHLRHDGLGPAGSLGGAHAATARFGNWHGHPYRLALVTTRTTMNELNLPSYADVLAASERIAGHAHHTPVATSRTANEELGAEVFFKCETMQRMDAYK